MNPSLTGGHCVYGGRPLAFGDVTSWSVHLPNLARCAAICLISGCYLSIRDDIKVAYANKSFDILHKERVILINKKIAMYGSCTNFIAVTCFAICMLFNFDCGSYFFSMFIAFSFVVMACGYAYFAEKETKLAGYASVAFSAIYASIILLVYFAQLTTVRLDNLTQQAASILDFQQSGLLFNYDLLGYGVMSLSTLFAGLTIKPQRKIDTWLRYLLMVHGVFFISCLIIPMLGVFKTGSPKWIGIAVLEFWCAYFCPIGILSFLHFRNRKE